MKNAVNNRIAAGKNITEIGEELCGNIANPQRKIIRIIKEIDGKGEQYLLDNAEKLNFKGVSQLKKAIEKREEKKKQKDNAAPNAENIAQNFALEKPLNEQLIELIKKYREEDQHNWKKNLIKFIDEFEAAEPQITTMFI